jgi:hypothetical protein
MPDISRRRAAKCFGDCANQYTIISFHLPPTAANAAVSGHPLTGLERRARVRLPEGAFLIEFMGQTIFHPHSVGSQITPVCFREKTMVGVCRNRIKPGREFRKLLTISLFCCLAVILQPLQGFAQKQPAPAEASPQLTRRDGQHDFDFEIGTWKTHLKRLLKPLTGSHTWVEYEGTTVVRKVWNGRANLVELVADGPAGHFEGLNLRLYNPQSRQWSLNFASVNGGVMTQPTIGEFRNGRGEFFDQETFDGRAILVRFIISDVTPNSCRFEQAFSDDGGKTWEVNWIATDTRVTDNSSGATALP